LEKVDKKVPNLGKLNYETRFSDARYMQIVKGVPDDVYAELKGLIERAMKDENNVRTLF